MSSYSYILDKLNGFSKKFYIKQLIKGSFLFLTFGLLFWIAITFLEQLLWMNQSWRLTLFLIFLLVELFLLYKFIAIPLFFLFRLRKGMNNKEASRLIGRHFHEVDDKLLNLLELSENPRKSDLLLASIEQRAKRLGPVPFAEAINFRESYTYARYIFIPLGLLGFIWVSGNIVSFFNSNERVMNYDLAYERPAPFKFKVLNESLVVLDKEPLVIKVTTEGSVKPENIFMVMNGEQMMLRDEGEFYSYTFDAPVMESTFFLTANGWNSRSYNIVSHRTPTLTDFAMVLDFPNYLKRTSEEVTGTGNALVPEGTRVSWRITGDYVDGIEMHAPDSTYLFSKDGDFFTYQHRLYKDYQYELSTSNAFVSDFERLNYRIDVLKDEKPTIRVEQILDTLNPNQSFYSGQAADDYGITMIQLVCFPAADVQAEQRIVLESPKSSVHQFYYTFPSGLQLQAGVNYKLYFEVVDNDGIRDGKISRSQVFSATLFDDKELKNKELQLQSNTINKLDNTIKSYKEQQKELSKLNDAQKEERGLTFEDRNQIKDYLERQKRQEQLMEKFSRELNKSIDKSAQDSERQKMLKERLERQEIEARKNERLLEELNKIAEQIEKEELQKRLEELSKNQSKNARNLEQILELTKRYYVAEKMSQLAGDLEELAKRQEELSDRGKDNQSLEDQKKVNDEFKELSKQLDELRKDNDDLAKPMPLDVSKKEQEKVKEDQEDALEELEKMKKTDEQGGSQQNASKKQKSAAQKMEEMSNAMQQAASSGGSSDSEDAEMLRQILDNLVTFSFKQENLFDKVENSDVDISQFSKTVRDQKELRRLFEHVDDSLFALSLRRTELSEFVNEQITEVYYNIDKSLESIAENQIYQGASYQQYVINATNSLADFLANILDNMQQNMKPGQGSGQGSDFQLPDIIQGQQSIQDKMQGKGNSSKPSQQEGQGQEGSEKGNSSGDKNQGNTSNGDGEENKQGGHGLGDDELGLDEVYEIYKEQQFLRQKLEEQLNDMLNKGDQNLAKKLIQQMEDFENDLLENGITERTRSKSNRIQHELMKLENATLTQGEKKERESTANKNNFSNPITTRPDLLKDYQNDTEILNRQALPLRQNYDKKVKVYFKND